MRLESYPKGMHADSVCDALGMRPRQRWDRLRLIAQRCAQHYTFQARRLEEEAREALQDEYDRELFRTL